ncbi:TFIID and SAGA subunit [Fomitiporia mediterranea MF3/22]|uniref:TFIID and SAGA subunit n=1 Tax=Fomitiporia mediterranea (strain MF3/22) TaxID=694068 RepID=UPI0004407387|nr:TFIID and SAGA subunit [Fomitiporia mediterranea MF3/22]EJD04005.1 TFIID and SAGA subunit [Fomitiporia mediterranea MF3/22]
MVLDFLRQRGHADAERALREALGLPSPPTDSDANASPEPAQPTVSDAELRKHLVPFWQKNDKPGENALADAKVTMQSLKSGGVTTPSVSQLLETIKPGGADEILSLDPTDKHEGFRDLETWVDGSLDMYRPEFRPILFPIFCQFYLDLIQLGFRDASLEFFKKFSPSLAPWHSKTLHRLSTLLLPSHVQQDELAQRFRNEKYVLRMSRSGFNLLVGWLTEGVGGEGTGVGEGFTGERGKRGRAAIMRVVNNHLQFDVTSSSTTVVPSYAWEESTGLLSSVVPQSAGATDKRALVDAAAYNASKGDVKLGPPPIDEGLQSEVERFYREQVLAGSERELTAQDLRPSTSSDLISPQPSDMPPLPPSFKTMDVKREVERIRDARKKIKLEPSALTLEKDSSSPQAAAARARALPSICCYTMTDVGDGVPCSTFSQDSSLMAVGFAESYIRLWNLKQEKLRGMRTSHLRKTREREAGTTRKLIGHSGPVYSLSFDPLSGSAAPPQYLLSSSADCTVRLWSMEDMSNVVAYRGHQSPVWDVQWSPLGVYFATGSRDKTARLWSSDRISALRIYAGHLSDVDCVKFHPNSLYLATGSSDWTCRLWDVQKGTAMRVFIGHQGPITSLAMSPDGRYLASAGEDLAINLWDLGSGRRVKKMTGHTASVYSMAFSSESSLLVSGGADWTVRCWDVKGSGGSTSRTGPRENGIVNGVDGALSRKDHAEEDGMETSDLLATFPTKRTPIINVQFTPRNLCLVSGPSLP